MALYNVFTRTFWKESKGWPNGLEPCLGRKTYIERAVTYSEAREICKQWNRENPPGRLSRKAEFEEY